MKLKKCKTKEENRMKWEREETYRRQTRLYQAEVFQSGKYWEYCIWEYADVASSNYPRGSKIRAVTPLIAMEACEEELKKIRYSKKK
jgi:hypothetical protein